MCGCNNYKQTFSYHNKIFILSNLYPTMILGRPENRRKRNIPTIMNEREEQAFLEYFEGWKTNREVTGHIKNSKKKIKTEVGIYSNKFVGKKWFNTNKKYFNYRSKNKKGKIITKGQYVPAYKSNIKPCIDYFLFAAEHSRLESFLSNKYSISTLYLFFELKEIRELFTLFSKVTFWKPLNIYDSFIKIIDQELIYNWLYFEGKFNLNSNGDLNLDPLILEEYLLIRHNKTFEEVLKLIKKYYLNKRDDWDKVEIREKIVKEFETSWEKFRKEENFEWIKKVNKIMNSGYPADQLEKKIKIKYFSGLLHDEKISSTISNTFLGYSAKTLIHQQRPPITLKFKDKIIEINQKKGLLQEGVNQSNSSQNPSKASHNPKTHSKT
jgi:hypothetical protein